VETPLSKRQLDILNRLLDGFEDSLTSCPMHQDPKLAARHGVARYQ
jgi:hypothetical protein